MIISRRTALTSIAGIATLGIAEAAAADDTVKKTKMGLCQYCAGFARQAAKRDDEVDLFEPERFFEFARRLGAGGYQVALGVLPAERAARLRRQAESAGMYIEGIVKAPKNKGDLERFAAEMQSAAAAGAKMVRSTIFSGRRYEVFESMEQYRQHDAQAMRSLELAAPIAEKFRVAFAPENHKDHRIAERVAALRKIDSEFVGVCVDTGNNFALLEDPVDTVKALAPWARGVHIKDQALQLTPEGFLFGDIPLGQGFIDLRQIVTILRRAKPDIYFTLELLTRDPLRVPCLEEKYWRTFADIPATDLARTLRTVRDNQHPRLQYPSRMSLLEQVALERANLEQSIRYAVEHLSL